MNLNELKIRAYEIACEHGWHEEEQSDEELLMLVITEIAEAVNADRRNHHADVEAFKKYEDSLDFMQNFERQIKDTVEDELSDVVIRCLSMAGSRSIDLSAAMDFIDKLSEVECKKDTDGTFAELMFEVVKLISSDDADPVTKINVVLICIIELCRAKNIDIEWFVEQKMKYNALRPYKHGGKKY